MPAWRDWLDHPTRDGYWQAQSFQQALENVDLPMLHVSGWYDDVLVGTTENYAITRDKAHQFLMLGPWGHRINQGRRIGAIDFGPDAVVDLDALFERWFDRWLKETPNRVEQDPAVRYFVMGANQWRTADAWPVPGMQPTRFYLSSGGRANSRLGDGRLVRDVPGDEPPDHYTADPDRPVVFVTDDAFSQIGGPDDYREVEMRQDVLVYTSDALTAPMTICGPMRASIVAASSATDTDWMTKVVAVRPDGFALRLNDGVVRARFRQGRDRQVLLTPGAIERYEIDNWSTCIEVGTGWRLRLEVASHAFPKFDVNLQTGGPIGKETAGVVASQTVLPRPGARLVRGTAPAPLRACGPGRRGHQSGAAARHVADLPGSPDDAGCPGPLRGLACVRCPAKRITTTTGSSASTASTSNSASVTGGALRACAGGPGWMSHQVHGRSASPQRSAVRPAVAAVNASLPVRDHSRARLTARSPSARIANAPTATHPAARAAHSASSKSSDISAA